MNNVDIKAIDCVFVFLGDFGGGGVILVAIKKYIIKSEENSFFLGGDGGCNKL